MGNQSKEEVNEADKSALRRRMMGLLGPCAFLMACESSMLIKSRSRLVEEISNRNAEKTAALLSTMMGAGALLEFTITPLLGSLSDVYGRRRMLLSSVYGMAVCRLAVVAQPHRKSVVGFDRMITMLMATTFFSTIRATLADLCENGVDIALSSCEIARWAGLGLFVGPYLEAALTRMGGGDHSFAFLGASGISFATAVVLATRMKETVGESERAELNLWSCLPFMSLQELSKSDTIRLLLTVCFLQTMVDTKNLVVVTQSFLRQHLLWSKIKTNIYLAATGAALVISTFFAQSSLTTLGLDGHTTLSNLCQIIGSLLIAVAPAKAPLDAVFVHASLLISVGAQRKREGTEALVIRAAQEKAHGVGQTLASLASLRAMASVVGPLLFGTAYSWGTQERTKRYLPGTPFVCGAAMAVAAEVVFRSLKSTKLVENNLRSPWKEASEDDVVRQENKQVVSSESRDMPSGTFLNKSRQTVRLMEKIVLSQDTRLFRFGLGSSSMKLGLPIGKHIKFWCANPRGVEAGLWNGRPDSEAGKGEIERKYTPTSSDDDVGVIDVVIKVYKPNAERFKDGGKMSQHIDNLSIGDTIDLAGPFGLIEYKGKGNLDIRRKTRHFEHLGMLAGGTGITPMLQLIKAVLKDPTDTTTLSLLYANQSEEDILVRDLLEEQVRKHPSRFRIWYTVDRPSTGWKYSTGFINEEMIKQSMPPPSPDTLILMCGPPPMIKFACKANLDKLGYDPNNYTEF